MQNKFLNSDYKLDYLMFSHCRRQNCTIITTFCYLYTTRRVSFLLVSVRRLHRDQQIWRRCLQRRNVAKRCARAVWSSPGCSWREEHLQNLFWITRALLVSFVTKMNKMTNSTTLPVKYYPDGILETT